MSPSAQALYFHFGMNADDDGFCEMFTVMRMTESKPDDLRALAERWLVNIFDDKVLIITDRKENNYIQKDRYTPSKYLEMYKNELALISQKRLIWSECIQDVYKTDTQVSIDKVSIEIGKERKKENNTNVLLQNPVGFWKEEINSLIWLIRKYNDWIVDWKQEEQRRYWKMLFDKLESIESVKEKKYTSAEILEIILKIVSKSEYHSHKIVWPKKIYYALGELMQICKQEIKKENKSNVSTF